MNKLIAYCGLNCEKCDAYLATLNNDQTLRKKTAALWSKLNNVTIRTEDINCEGCRANGKKTIYSESLCEIRQCALKRSLNTCGDCQELETCQKINKIISTNSEALNNLKKE